jgi:hypothetical protein
VLCGGLWCWLVGWLVGVQEVTPYIKNIVTICLQHMTHDPNYTYDDADAGASAGAAEAGDEKMGGADDAAQTKSDDADADWSVTSHLSPAPHAMQAGAGALSSHLRLRVGVTTAMRRPATPNKRMPSPLCTAARHAMLC